MELLVTASMMRQCDAATIREIGIPSLVLMERAAMAVVDELKKHAPSLSSVMVFCGAGNNGGDGFAIARLLDEEGIPVSLVFLGKETSLTEEASVQKAICEKCGILPITGFWEEKPAVIVDALFGVGLSRPVEGKLASAINWMNCQDAYRVAVDIPSGVSADTGEILGTAYRADLTVTFAYRKLGHILYPGTEYCGIVIRRDIGITSDGLRRKDCAFFYDDEDLALIPPRLPYSNKGTYGKVLLIGGSFGMSGAAFLSALAAYRTGCGLVRIFTPACNREILQSGLPDAIVTAWDESDCTKKLEECLAWADAVVLGPGMGRNKDTRYILSKVLSVWRGPLVLDADGLNELSRNTDVLLDTEASVIVTPHVGEMARLCQAEREDITEDLIAASRDFASAHHVVCVLKDARTVISDGEKVCINTSGNNGMAVGGSGDVLTGIIASLLAQGMLPFEAASLGVYLHGKAGDAAKKKLGSRGMMARDIAGEIPGVLRDC